MRKIGKFVATLFFIGYIPLAPGTVASILALSVYLLIKDKLILYFSSAIFFLILGFWSSSVAEKEFHRKDPPQIIIDEFSALLLVYIFIPFNIKFLVIGFVLFRLFDIFKIPPIKKLHALPKGWGIMLDDIASAILANIILQIVLFAT